MNRTKFWDWCVDFENGDPKPQIRVHDTMSLFNISNFFQFENIEFTGEDAMAKVNSTYKYYNEHEPVFQNVPLIKCNFTREPTGHLEQAPVEQVFEHLSDIVFNCSSGFNLTTDSPESTQDFQCDPGKHEDSNSPAYCLGEPW